jgi:hypothetical protein
MSFHGENSKRLLQRVVLPEEAASNKEADYLLRLRKRETCLSQPSYKRSKHNVLAWVSRSPENN